MTDLHEEPDGLLPPELDPYVSWRRPLRTPGLTPGKTCLLIIDMTYADASWDHGGPRIARAAGLEKEFSYFRDKLQSAIANIARLQAWARRQGIEVMFVRIASQTSDGAIDPTSTRTSDTTTQAMPPRQRSLPRSRPYMTRSCSTRPAPASSAAQ
jgi:nicotinamidase-related amidase